MKFSDLLATSSSTLGNCDSYLWQVGWLDWAASVLLNHHEGRLGTWPWGSCVSRAECHPMSQLMVFIASHFRRLAMVWTLFGSISCLQIRHMPHALSFKDSGVCLRASLEGSQGHAFFLFFSPFPGPWPPSPILCYKRYWWLSGPSYLKRQQGPAAVAVITLSWYLMHFGTRIC